MALFSRKSRAERELRLIVGEGELPSFPHVTTRILARLRDPDAELEAVAESLQWDAGLVLQVLRTVNSPAYGPAARIHDVRHAITFMGRSQLEQLVLAIAVKNALPAAPAPGFQRDRYWRAAAFRAAFGRALAEKLHPARHAEAFTAGLLQDMAIPILAHARPDEYGKVLEEWHEDGDARLHELELEAFGWSHDEVGGLLGRHWELSDTLVDAIALHHVDAASDRELLPSARLVSVWRETRAEHGLDALVEHARADYGLDPDWLRESVAECEKQAEELAASLFA